jgi:hypothetical protein
MKSTLWMIGGLCAAAAGFLVLGCRRTPVELLAHRFEGTWHDHRTVVETT